MGLLNDAPLLFRGEGTIPPGYPAPKNWCLCGQNKLPDLTKPQPDQSYL